MSRFSSRNGRTASSAIALFIAVSMLACGGDKSTGPSGPGQPTETWVSASARSWTTSAQTESYECHSELAATDAYYTGFRLASPSAVQTEVYLSVRPTVTHVGDFDCDFNALVGGEAIYTGAQGTTSLTFSGGKGVHVPAGQYVLLVVLLNNTTMSNVSGTTTIEGRQATSADVTTPMDMFFSGKLNFVLDPDAPDTTPVAGQCKIGDDTHVVAALPLMHRLGISQKDTWSDGSATVHSIGVTQFDYHHDPYIVFAADSLIAASDHLSTTCEYLNNTGFVVNFGESSTDELCFTAFYRYPPKPPTATSPLECAEGETI